MTTTDLHSLLGGLDDFVEEQMKHWKGVGAAVAVVHKNEVVWQKGYGYRDLEAKLGVTPNTLFAIGSSTKAFTAATAAILVDQNQLNWDTPIVQYMPDFKMFDPVTTERLTIRDILCHRSGLPRHEMAWYNSPRSREELVHCLRYLEPNEDFRNKWQYQNIMYMTAGYLVGQIKGTSWESVLEDSLLRPLGMNSSVLSVDLMQLQPEYALPYMEKDEQHIRIPYRNVDTIGPAGSINSNLIDMITWLKFQLNQGQHDGRALISTEEMQTMHSPHMPCDSSFRSEEVPISTYGLGWIIESYRGHRMIHHGGGIDGFTSQVAFLPDEQIGVVVLCNSNGSVVPYTVSYHIIDRLLELEPTDWSDRLTKLIDGEGTQPEDESEATEGTASVGSEHQETTDFEKKEVQPFDRPASEYIGVYTHLGYGDFLIESTAEGELRATFNNLDMSMQYIGNETFDVELVQQGQEQKLPFTFTLDDQNHTHSLKIPLLMEPNTNEVIFTKTKTKANVTDDIDAQIES
ncbi:serine hydrolase [Paenibacillus tundrae]|uniref:CubicO group peptidase (Beta-lactamase class C family) n=1 Tax=Paenibacillus tundrae TaxID=528187 RepID=A0ABT9WBC8_9BACL|nr:serine hydrolase [Paenibacillus tundrae]MDQ0170374.1 CubicO group peptidase (beta-lactamase class C family) [Paenibacillus tundrae]